MGDSNVLGLDGDLPGTRRGVNTGLVCVVLVAAWLALLPQVALGQVALHVQELADDGMRFDGMLRDWRHVRMTSVGEGADASMRFALGYDRTGLVLAAQVTDDRFVRTASPGLGEDAIIITLAIPQGSRLVGHEIFVYAGVPGQSSGQARSGPLGARRLRPVQGAEVIEAPADGGYTIEARIPWRAIPGSRRWQEARGSVRLRDVDAEARSEIESEPAFSVVEPRNLERLPKLRPSGGEQAIIDRFLEAQSLGAIEPRQDLRGDVCGDARPERVLLVERFVLVLGAGYKDGTGYDFMRLPVEGSGDVHATELVDLTGDGKRELITRLTQRDERGSRALWQLFSFDCQSITPLFGVETRKETREGHLEVDLEIGRSRRGGAPTIEIASRPPQGVAPEGWRESPASDAVPILLPWGPVLGRTYRWDGQRFAIVDERPNPHPFVPRADAPEPVRPAPVARAPNNAQLLEAVRRRIGATGRPRFLAEANLAEDATPELAAVYGRTLVVVGSRFRGGDGFFQYGIPVPGDGDVLELRAEDLTGDGRAELLLRVRQLLGDVQRELLMVHRFARDGGFPMMLSVEVAREKERNRIENEVRIERGVLEIRPGRTRGWSRESWPWGTTAGSGDVEALLLPWSDRPVRYRAVDGRLIR